MAMKPIKAVIPFEEAKRLLFSSLKPVEEIEEIEISRAGGRVMAEKVTADIDVPPFTRSAMDGYAVIAKDTFPARKLQPVELELIDVVEAGEVSSKEVVRGTCIQVATGALLPKGADAVVMFEDTEIKGKVVKVYEPVYPGANVTSQGADIKKGTTLLDVGTFLSPSKIGVLAAIGRKKVKVFIKPEIAIIPSGNEIVDVGSPLVEGKLFDVNSYTLSALVEENGCIPQIFPIMKDEIDDIKTTLSQALSCHLIVITGGSSVGERDLIAQALSNLGTILFHGIAVKPGKPTVAALAEGKLIIGMPGYPTSCLTNGYAILVPLLRKLARLPPKEERIVKAPLGRRVTSTIGRHQFLPVKIVNGEVIPVFKESGAITSMSDADGYIEIPAPVDFLEKGEEVEVKLF